MIATVAWPENRHLLHLSARSNRCSVLGPGMRAVLWVQGCPLRCPGCVAVETLPFKGGEKVEVPKLAEELLALPDIEGLTFSGGEPFAQASALCALLERVRTHRDLSAVSYSGFPLEYIKHKGTSAQHELLQRLDILIDGPYLRGRHTDLRWRGSDNQRVHLLSDRYRDLAGTVDDRGTWLEFEFTEDDHLQWMGIPPPEFRQVFEKHLADMGVLEGNER